MQMRPDDERRAMYYVARERQQVREAHCILSGRLLLRSSRGHVISTSLRACNRLTFGYALAFFFVFVLDI